MGNSSVSDRFAIRPNNRSLLKIKFHSNYCQVLPLLDTRTNEFHDYTYALLNSDWLVVDCGSIQPAKITRLTLVFEFDKLVEFLVNFKTIETIEKESQSAKFHSSGNFLPDFVASDN